MSKDWVSNKSKTWRTRVYSNFFHHCSALVSSLLGTVIGVCLSGQGITRVSTSGRATQCAHPDEKDLCENAPFFCQYSLARFPSAFPTSVSHSLVLQDLGKQPSTGSIVCNSRKDSEETLSALCGDRVLGSALHCPGWGSCFLWLAVQHMGSIAAVYAHVLPWFLYSSLMPLMAFH